MKHLFMLTFSTFLLLLISLISAPTYADILSDPEYALDYTQAHQLPESEIRTYMGVDELFERFMEHYGRFIDPQNPQPVDFEFIMANSSNQISRELQYLFSTALDEGQDLSKFEVFGIKALENGHLGFNDKANFLMQLPTDLFSIWSNVTTLEYDIPKLIQRGFRPKDIVVLRQYTRNYGERAIKRKFAKHHFSYLESISAEIISAVKYKHTLSPEYYRHTLLKSYYIDSYYRNQFWRNWGLTLLSKFDRQRQRIIMSYLLENPNLQRVITGPAKVAAGASIDKYLNQLEQDVASGKWIEYVTKAVKAHAIEELRP